jgi:O-antigen/teichoic acid export membrane protein
MSRMRRLSRSFLSLALSPTAFQTYAVFFGNGLSAFFAFIFTVTLVRRLTFADFGYFSALLSFLLLVSDMSDIGIGSTLSAFLPKMRTDREIHDSMLHTAFRLQMTIAVVVGSSIIIFAPLLSGLLFHSQTLTGLVILTGASTMVTIIGNFFMYALSAQQKFYRVSFLSAYGGLIRLLLLIILLIAVPVTLSGSVIIQTISQAILMVTSIVTMGWVFIKNAPKRGQLKELISFSKYLALSRGLSAVASRIDVLMIVALTNATEAGIYSTASRVISIYPLLAGSFSTVIAPKFSHIKNSSELKRFVGKVILATFGLILTIFFLILISYPFMTTLFGQKAAAAVYVFRLLLISMIFFVASVPVVSVVIYYLRKPAILSVNGILQLFIAFIGNLILIPRLGREGAAYSLIVSYGITLVTTAVMGFVVYRRHRAA